MTRIIPEKIMKSKMTSQGVVVFEENSPDKIYAKSLPISVVVENHDSRIYGISKVEEKEFFESLRGISSGEPGPIKDVCERLGEEIDEKTFQSHQHYASGETPLEAFKANPDCSITIYRTLYTL
jgi:hypothetical protein